MDALIEQAGADAWELHRGGAWVVVPTNTMTRSDGTAVMGAGLARQAAERFADLPARYGAALLRGEVRLVANDHRLLLAPTKVDWRNPAIWSLVQETAAALRGWCRRHPAETLVVPALGCGLGGLDWPDVRGLLVEQLHDQRVVVIPPRT